MYFAERNAVINRRRHNIKTRVIDIFKKLEQLVAAFFGILGHQKACLVFFKRMKCLLQRTFK